MRIEKGASLVLSKFYTNAVLHCANAWTWLKTYRVSRTNSNNFNIQLRTFYKPTSKMFLAVFERAIFDLWEDAIISIIFSKTYSTFFELCK